MSFTDRQRKQREDSEASVLHQMLSALTSDASMRALLKPQPQPENMHLFLKSCGLLSSEQQNVEIAL